MSEASLLYPESSKTKGLIDIWKKESSSNLVLDFVYREDNV